MYGTCHVPVSLDHRLVPVSFVFVRLEVHTVGTRAESLKSKYFFGSGTQGDRVETAHACAKTRNFEPP